MKPIITMFICGFFIFIFVSGCANTQDNKQKDFFIWTDGYFASGEGSQYSVSLTYYFPNGSKGIDFTEVIRIEFLGISDYIKIDDFIISDMDFGVNSEYLGNGVSLDISFKKLGIYKTEYIEIIYSDSKSIIYPIGNWVFDIDEPENDGAIDTWGSPALSADEREFAYIYSLLQDESILKEIHYGENDYIFSDTGLNTTGSVFLDSDAPLSFIKAKIKYEYSGKTYIAYAKGCYCGAINLREDAIEKSIEYTAQKLNELNNRK